MNKISSKKGQHNESQQQQQFKRRKYEIENQAISSHKTLGDFNLIHSNLSNGCQKMTIKLNDLVSIMVDHNLKKRINDDPLGNQAFVDVILKQLNSLNDQPKQVRRLRHLIENVVYDFFEKIDE